MVPTVGGKAVRYQADRCARTWYDGSQTGCQFTLFLPGIAAGATEQVVWQVESGSYNHISNCTASCIYENSNLRVQLNQVNQTYYFTSPYVNVAYARFGFYTDPVSGAVTRGVISGQGALGQTPCGSGTCAVTIQGPGCTGSPAANVTFPLTVTITSAGSGCMTEGSGNFIASINKALINGPYNASNHCGFVRRYLKGPIADGWEIYCRFTDKATGEQEGYPFPGLRAWVEDYKNADGSVYAIRAAAAVVQDEYQPGGTWDSYTYDVQWYNGATATSVTCIRCVGVSGAPSMTNKLNYLPLTRIVQMNGGGAFTFGSDARMDWIPVNAGGATSMALNAVVPTMNTADKAYFKAAQVIEPIDDLVTLQPSSLVLTHTGDQNIIDDEGSFNSNTLGQQDCVNGWGTGGDHCWFAPVPSSGVNHYIATTAASDHGFSWLQSIRIATATQFSCQAGLYEQATRNPVNYLPSSVFTPPPAMTDPVRSGYGFPAFGGLVCFGFSSDWSTTGHPNFQWDHYSVYGRYTYLTEGEEWQLQEIDAAAQNMLGVFRDTASYGGHNFYGMSNQGYLATRLSAWTLNALQEATKFLPPTDPAEIYEAAILFTQEYPNQADILSYTGSDINVTYASGFVPSFEPGTKLADYTSFGYPINTDQIAIGNHGGQGFNIRNQFMDYYYAIVALDGAMLFPNESNAQSIWVNSFIENYMVASAASNANCYYNIINYYNPFADSNLMPFSGWEADASNPQIVNVFPRNDDTLTTFANQQEVEVSPFMAAYGSLHVAWATAATTVSGTGNTTVAVTDVSQARLGSIVVDTGPNACGGSCQGPGGPLPVSTGAIPNYFYVSAINGGAWGPGKITIACGASGGCAAPIGSINVGDVLDFSLRINYPDTDSNAGYVLPTGLPMPAGTVIKPVLNPEINPGDSHLGAFPPPPTTDAAIGAGYVWCPDPANPYGTTGFVNAPGTACSSIASRITFAQDTAAVWGFAPPLASCPPSGNWSIGGDYTAGRGPINGQSYDNSLYGVVKLAQAILGSTSATTTAINVFKPYAPESIYDSDPGNTYWAFDSGFAPTGPGGP